MIILGVAPGLGALAYSVVEAGQSGLAALDSDVLHAGRRLDAASAWQIARRCKAHQMVLDVVLRRHPPAVLSIGPRLDKHEPEEHVAAVRLLMIGLATALAVPVYDFGDRTKLLAELAAGPRGLKGVVTHELGSKASLRDRRIVLAAGAALAAARRVSRENGKPLDL